LLAQEAGFDSQQHLSYVLFVNLHTNCPFLTKQQQAFTSLPVSVQIIFLAEEAKPGAVNRAAANNPKMADFMCRTYPGVQAGSNGGVFQSAPTPF
jgi:hypothetical protein